jgi:Zn-dependent peptidase ImmA (M78 family)
LKAKDLPKLIPNRVRITKDISYEVVYIDEFTGESGYQYGECRYEAKQIVLNKNQPPTELLKTFIHEYFHAVSFETKGLELTEKQVRLLENSIFRSIKLNGWIK